MARGAPRPGQAAAPTTIEELAAQARNQNQIQNQNLGQIQNQSQNHSGSRGAAGRGPEGGPGHAGPGSSGAGRGGDGGRGPARPSGANVSWSSEEMQRMLLNRPDVKAQAQAIMGSRTLQDADKKLQIKELLKKLR